MNIRILITPILLTTVALPSSARDQFNLAPCDQITQHKATAPAAAQSNQLSPIQLNKTNASANDPNSKPSVLDQARKLNAMPLTLLPSAAEKQATGQAELDAEQQQITALWSSTLDRSPDIQFVINAMQPGNDPNHARSQAVKMIGGLMFNAGMQAGSMLSSAPLRMGSGAAVSTLGSLFNGKGKQQGDLSPASLASLYSMIRRSADRLVDTYRAYKNLLDETVLAEESVDDVQKVIAARDASMSSDAAIFLDMELKHALKDVHLCQQRTTTLRKQLIDMAGENSIAHLDEQISEEHNALARLTGSGSWRHPLEYTPPSTASQVDAPSNSSQR